MYRYYYITFGQESPFREGWIRVHSLSEQLAREWASQYPHWCGTYPEASFFGEGICNSFPAGQIGKVVEL